MIDQIEKDLKEMLLSHLGHLKLNPESKLGFEVYGTKKRMQGKRMVDGYYFASVVPKPKDVRLYFFPIYTHASKFNISPELQKALKGKSCFHLKKWNNDLKQEVNDMIAKGISLYLKDDLI